MPHECILSGVLYQQGQRWRDRVVSTLAKLKQVCNHPMQFLQDGSEFTTARSHKLTRLCEMIEDKKKLASAIVGSDESWLTGLDDNAFRELISLNKSAIME